MIVLIFALIVLLLGAGVAWMSAAIYQGGTKLIHAYHQTKVADSSAYGRAFGKALAVVAAALLSSGVISLLGEPEVVGQLAVGVLTAGLTVGLICIAAVQKRHNGGIF